MGERGGKGGKGGTRGCFPPILWGTGPGRPPASEAGGKLNGPCVRVGAPVAGRDGRGGGEGGVGGGPKEGEKDFFWGFFFLKPFNFVFSSQLFLCSEIPLNFFSHFRFLGKIKNPQALFVFIFAFNCWAFEFFILAQFGMFF